MNITNIKTRDIYTSTQLSTQELAEYNARIVRQSVGVHWQVSPLIYLYGAEN